MRIAAMIPARLGSKRVKSKNLRLLDGRPLVCHVAEKAKQAGVFDGIYINSESDIFEGLAKEYGVNFYKRPLELASDTATNDMFVLDFVDHVPCDIIVQINPTSTMITVEDIHEVVRMMKEEQYDTIHGVKHEQIEGMFKGQPLNFDPLKNMPPSQLLVPVVLFSSGIMAWRVSNYRENIKTLGAATYGGHGKIGYYCLKGFSTIDIDHEEDFQLAELAIAFQKDKNVKAPQYYDPSVRLRVEKDVDSILTNDGVSTNDFTKENQTIVNLKDLMKARGTKASWSQRIINTENNSATFINQLPGEGNRLHHHNDWNEWWYIAGGQWEFEIEGRKHLVKEGDVVFIEKNKWHKITAVGNTMASRLAVSKDKVSHIYKADA